MIVATPAETPVTITDPVREATEGALLDHVPPAETSDNVVVRPTQTFVTPVIAAGTELTVTTLMLMQPAPEI